MQNLKPRSSQGRSKINMGDPHQVECWIRHLKVSKDQLQKAVDKVGHGAAAVRKQLTASASQK